jgi:hypothetical protein
MANEPAPAQGGGTVTVVAAPAAAAEPKVTRQETDAFTMRLIGRYGSVENALNHLAGEQLRYRKRAQTAEAKAERLQKQVPTEGSVVLTGDEAKAHVALKAADAKFSLVTIGDSLKELSTLKSKDSTASRESTLTAAAGKQYKVNVLKRLVGDAPIEFKTVLQKKEDGEDGMEEVKVAYIKNGDVLELLDTWLAREHKEFLDVLKVKESDGTTTEESAPSTGTGAIMPKQTVSGDKPLKGKDAEVLKAVDRGMAQFMSPSQRRKEAAGGK